MRTEVTSFILNNGIVLGMLCIIGGVIAITFETRRWLRNRHEEQDALYAGHAYGRWSWSQDGWVRVCKFCHEWQYGGDDYDGGPVPVPYETSAQYRCKP